MFISDNRILDLNSYIYKNFNLLVYNPIKWRRWCNLASIEDCGSSGPGSNPGRRLFDTGKKWRQKLAFERRLFILT